MTHITGEGSILVDVLHERYELIQRFQETIRFGLMGGVHYIPYVSYIDKRHNCIVIHSEEFDTELDEKYVIHFDFPSGEYFVESISSSAGSSLLTREKVLDDFTCINNGIAIFNCIGISTANFEDWIREGTPSEDMDAFEEEIEDDWLLDAPVEPYKPDWLGGNETEEEFWEHTD